MCITADFFINFVGFYSWRPHQAFARPFLALMNLRRGPNLTQTCSRRIWSNCWLWLSKVQTGLKQKIEIESKAGLRKSERELRTEWLISSPGDSEYTSSVPVLSNSMVCIRQQIHCINPSEWEPWTRRPVSILMPWSTLVFIDLRHLFCRADLVLHWEDSDAVAQEIFSNVWYVLSFPRKVLRYYPGLSYMYMYRICSADILISNTCTPQKKHPIVHVTIYRRYPT